MITHALTYVLVLIHTYVTEGPGNSCAILYVIVQDGGADATCYASRSHTRGWLALPHRRNGGDRRRVFIGQAARAARGCLAPKTHKSPGGVPADFRITPTAESACVHHKLLYRITSTHIVVNKKSLFRNWCFRENTVEIQ